MQLLGGLAEGKDVFELASSVAELHPRHNTFPGEVYMGLASDALELAQVGRDDPLEYRSLLDVYLSECEFHGWDKRKIQYAILTGAALRGGIEPDLLNDTAWRTDDYWRYALFACVAVIRACAIRWRSQSASLRNVWPGCTVSSSNKRCLRNQWDGSPWERLSRRPEEANPHPGQSTRAS